VVIAGPGEYGRTAFGDDYLNNLCSTIQRLRGKVPDSDIDEISR
jgi:hypothetical protein